MDFYRDTELVEHLSEFAQTIENEAAKQDLLRLIHKYEHLTFAEWKDQPKFEAAAISDWVNNFGFPDDEIAKKMATDHPTLQQSFMRLCLKFIKEMSEKTYYDGRNKASVEKAKKIMEALDGNIWLPLI